MARQNINIGSNANDGTGDDLRTAMQKINTNFTELYAETSVDSGITISGNTISSNRSDDDIVFEPSGTGAVRFPAVTINDNAITGTRSNEDLTIAASGTGLQAVASGVANLGSGISHGIGVGGRDLSAEVGGLMTFAALDWLDRDPGTSLIVLVSKPPAASVLPQLQERLARLSKPAVVCCVGATAPASFLPGVDWMDDLDATAAMAVATVALGRDEGAFEDELEAAAARRPAP